MIHEGTIATGKDYVLSDAAMGKLNQLYGAQYTVKERLLSRIGGSPASSADAASSPSAHSGAPKRPPPGLDICNLP